MKRIILTLTSFLLMGFVSNRPTMLHIKFKNATSKLSVESQGAIKDYFSKYKSDSLNESHYIRIILYPQEMDFTSRKNIEKYYGRAINVVRFIRRDLGFKGEIELVFKSKEEFMVLEDKSFKLEGFFSMFPR